MIALDLRRRSIAVAVAPETVTVALLAIAFAVGASLSPYFLDARALLDSTSLYMETGVMALAMTFVIVGGHIDLSVASNLTLTAVLTATISTRLGVSMAIAAPLAIVIGALLGLFNGLLITRLRLPSLTVTLGTLALYRGLAQVLAGDRSIGGFPAWFVGLDERYVGPLPVPLVVFLALALVAGVALRKTTFGRRVVAIGTSATGARYSGVGVERVTLALFTLSGAAAGVGAVMMLSRLRVARYNLAIGDELAVITAVVLGGTDIAGGRGGIFGTVVALFLLGVIRKAMGIAEMPPDAQLVVTGTLLVVAVLLARGSARAGRWARSIERRRNEHA